MYCPSCLDHFHSFLRVGLRYLWNISTFPLLLGAMGQKRCDQCLVDGGHCSLIHLGLYPIVRQYEVRTHVDR